MIRKINSSYVRVPSSTIDGNFVTPTATTTCGFVQINPNQFKLADTVVIRAALLKSGTTNSYDMKLYWNTGTTITGASLLGSYTIPATTRYVQFSRRIWFYQTNSLFVINPSSSQLSDVDQPATTTIGIPSFDISKLGYFLISITASPSGTDKIKMLYLSLSV